jgi:hypothetical protein
MRFVVLLVGLMLTLISPASGQRPAQRAGDGGAGTITGVVVTEAGAPLASVRVAARSVADSAVVAGAVTGLDGRFRIRGLAPGAYRVQASRIGYTPLPPREVTVTAAQPAVALGTLRLTPAAVALEGLVVESERSEVVVAPDRTIYSTRDMPVASGGMATDVLQTVPELEVDISGNVQLRGTTPQIYLNGRPAPMQGESLQLFLQQFPADRIDRVEVIPNPSARFEAEGSAGIVNIVLKKNTSIGLSGSAFVNGGTRGNLGSGVNLTYQEGPLTLIGGGFLRVSRRDDTSYDFRQNLLANPITFLEQDGWRERLGSSASANLTAEYKLSERSTFWSEVQAFRRGSEEDALVAYRLLNADSLPMQRYDRATAGEDVGLNTELVAGFRHTIEPRRHELELEIQYERGVDDEESLIRRLFFTPTGEDANLPVELTVEDEDEAERELGVELDYVRPLGEATQLEVGYRGDFERTENGRLLQIFASEGAADPISSSDNGFNHQETFHSAYLTLMRTFGPLGVQAGVRAERADTRLGVPGGEQFDKDYRSVFPNANLRYDLGGGREVRLSYSKRIQRPREWVLNPINSSDDPLNRRIGNPDIDPAYTHNASLDASWSGQAGTLRFSPFYRHTVDDWAQIKTVDDSGVSTVTWENLASVKNYGTTMSANLRRVGAVSGFVSLSAYREERDASNLALDYSGSSLQWSSHANLQARLNDDLNLQGSLFYRPAREVPQGRFGSMVMTQLGVRQQLLNDKMSLNLNVRDPLGIARFSFETRDPTHIQTGRTTPSMRSVVLSLSYSFGRPPRNTRREEREEEEPGMQAEEGIR